MWKINSDGEFKSTRNGDKCSDKFIRRLFSSQRNNSLGKSVLQKLIPSSFHSELLQSTTFVIGFRDGHHISINSFCVLPWSTKRNRLDLVDILFPWLELSQLRIIGTIDFTTISRLRTNLGISSGKMGCGTGDGSCNYWFY